MNSFSMEHGRDLTRIPKVVLHDHLDGGLRAATIIDIAQHSGYTQLPSYGEHELAQWFVDAANSGSLVRYLETFDHTVAVMQTADSLERIAYECAQDLAQDGVVYAEIRYAPEQHLLGGLSLEEVVVAVRQGFERGEKWATDNGYSLTIRQLLSGMRHADRTTEIAELAVQFRDKGVVGFDIAGAEIGFPPSMHKEGFDYLRDESFPYTIHAGEACGVESIHDAVAHCGAWRIGHGVHIIDDINADNHLGKIANVVRDQQIALELCPTSNVQTGAVASLDQHPFRRLDQLQFRVTVNTDNRLMGGTSMSQEMGILVAQWNYDLNDLKRLTINAINAAFIHWDQREAILNDIIIPGYASYLS